MGVALSRTFPPFLASLLVASSGFAPLAVRAQTVASSPTPTPAASADPASESPLRTIGRVRATTPLCRVLVGHASSAVDLALGNDLKLVFIEQTLRTTDLDSDQLKKANGEHRIVEEFVALRASAAKGQQEMEALRTAAKDAPTAEQRAALTDFANALEGALVRQKKLADTLGRFIAYLDAHEPISKDQHDQMLFDQILAQNSAFRPSTVDAFGNVTPQQRGLIVTDNPADLVPDQLSTTASAAATELAHRAEPVARDETDAAGRMDAAFSGC